MLNFEMGKEIFSIRKSNDEKLNILKENECNLLILESKKNPKLGVRIIEATGKTELEFRGRKLIGNTKAYYVYDDTKDFVLKDKLALEVALELLRTMSSK